MKLTLVASLLVPLWLVGFSLFAQGLDPAQLLKLPTDTWPTYNGDYSGRRFSTLSRINSSNVTSMTLAWEYRLDPGTAR
jgi:alcohol dehydrogenase (cytochrome c)